MSFLDSNLAALADKPQHRQMVDKLRAHPPTGTDRFELCETAAGDYSLLVDGQPIHSLQGSQAEARQIVAREFHGKRYSQNLILGLGLGYLLKTTMETKLAHESQAKVVVYETDFELLHFILSHVDLHQWLEHPDVTLFHLPIGFFQQINGQYIKGDGMGVMFTPSYCQVYQEKFADIVTRLERNVDNANRNTELLQLRAKDWAKHFLQNTAVLPTGLPVDHLKDSFKDKTVILVSAGPSLADSIETLRAIRDKVVIIAVGGAMRTLNLAGIVPHFIMYMDFLGPSKHLFGLEQPNRGSHVITGPSAERYALDLDRKSLWVSSLHFNEQFGWCLDEMFGHPLLRYHTGGTVSLLAFHIAVDMGFHRFVLLGQDLALRNNQLYADGTMVEVGDDDVMRMSETPTSPAKNIKVRRVPSWIDGETVVSPEDYAHFLMHFENLVPLIRDVRADVELINASKGGAFIKGYQHIALEALAAELQAGEPIDVDGTMAAIEAAIRPDYDPDVLATRTHATLKQLLAQTRHCVLMTEKARPMLTRLMGLPYEQWFEVSQAYSQVFNDLAELLEGNAFFKHTFFHEQLTLHQKHNDAAASQNEHLANFNLDRQYMESIAGTMTQRLIPWLESALAELEKGYAVDPHGILVEGIALRNSAVYSGGVT